MIQHPPIILKARAQMVVEEPFWGTLAMHLVLRPVVDPMLHTMATDGSTLYYNPVHYSQPGIEMKGVKRTWKHEVLHCVLGHMSRRGNRDPERWNIACDHVVNLILKKSGEEIPPDRHCDDRFDGMSAEKIYRVLEDEERQQQEDRDEQESPDQDQQEDKEQDDEPAASDADGNQDDDAKDEGDEPSHDDAPGDGDEEGDGEESSDPNSGEDGEPGDGDDGSPTDEGGDRPGGAGGGDPEGEPASAGSGSGVPDGSQSPVPVFCGDPGGDGEILDAAPSQEKAALDKAADEWSVFAQQAVNIAKRQGEGRLPGFAESIVEQLNAPDTDWREATRRFIEPMSMTKDYSWSQPNRRMLGLDFIVPGQISNGAHHGAIIVDSSYSIDEELLKRFGAEAQGALDDGTVDKITLIFCDTRVTRSDEYSKGDMIDFSVPGRGGTDFAPAFAWLNEHAPDIAFAIYFTDLECTSYGPQPDYPVLWAGYGNPETLDRYRQLVPWGEHVDVGDPHQ